MNPDDISSETEPQESFANHDRRMPARISFLRSSLNVIVCIAGLLIVAAILHRLIPTPHITQVSDKLNFYEAHRNDYNAVFIGSSRFYHQISPAIFDRTLGQHRVPMKSFNFGVDAMMPPESFHMVRKILARKPPALKLVFVEVVRVRPVMDSTFLPGIRNSYWRDFPATWLLLKRDWADFGHEILKFPRLTHFKKIANYFEKMKKNSAMSFPSSALNLKLYGNNFASVGRVIDDLKSNLPPIDSHFIGSEGDGFRPLSKKKALITLPKHLADYKKRVAYMEKRLKERDLTDSSTINAYIHLAKLIKRSGAIPVFIIPPTTDPIGIFHLPKNVAPVLAYDDPARYPHLYNPKERHDSEHLLPDGAKEFTRLIAQDFLKKTSLKKSR